MAATFGPMMSPMTPGFAPGYGGAPWMGYGQPMMQQPWSPPLGETPFHMDVFGSLPGPTMPVKSTNTNESVRYLQRLGSGVFGEVWKAEYKGEVVAAKVTACPTGFRAEELELLREAQGPHTVKLLAVEEGTPKGTAIVMELCDGSLADGACEPRCEHDFLDTLMQVLEGLRELHERGIIFGDLKPDNLLRKGGRILYADFGDARDTSSDLRGRSVHELGWGSPMYHARPDVMKQRLTAASDLWMVAQTAIHLWSGEEARCNPSPMPDDIPVRELLQRCLASEPSARPTAEEALLLIQEALHLPPQSPTRPRRRASLPTATPPRSEPTSPSADAQFRRRRSHGSIYDFVRDSSPEQAGFMHPGTKQGFLPPPAPEMMWMQYGGAPAPMLMHGNVFW